MNFPNSAQGVMAAATERLSAVKSLREEATRLEAEAKKQELIAIILKGLLEGWCQSDPGKYRDAFFFLESWGARRIVVAEFLPEGTEICKTSEEWEAYCNTKSWKDAPHKAVPPWYAVLPLAEVNKAICPGCQTQRPLIERYVQAYDSPEGDEWLKERFVLCLECNRTAMLESKRSDSRF